MEWLIGFMPFGGSVLGAGLQALQNASDAAFGTNSKEVYDSLNGPVDGGSTAIDSLSIGGGPAKGTAGGLSTAFTITGLFTSAGPRAKHELEMQRFIGMANYDILGKAENATDAARLGTKFSNAVSAYYDKNLSKMGISESDWSGAIQSAMQGNPNSLYKSVMGEN